MVLLFLDLSGNKNLNFISLSKVISESQATGCGVNGLNHQVAVRKPFSRWGGGGPTDYSIVFYDDCEDMENSCCPLADIPRNCIAAE